MKLKANAKINLFLRVSGVDERGFHILDSLVFSVDIFDTVIINKKRNDSENGRADLKIFDGKAVEKIERERENVCADSEILDGKAVKKEGNDGENGRVSLKMSRVLNGKNNALAAAESLTERYGLPGTDIFIEKKIPVAAGLGGSSADTAAVIFGFGKLFGMPIDKKLCSEFGDDVPFMLRGGAEAVCGGADLFAEKKNAFADALKRYTFLVVKPFGEMLTERVFRVYDERIKRGRGDENSETCGGGAITLSEGDIRERAGMNCGESARGDRGGKEEFAMERNADMRGDSGGKEKPETCGGGAITLSEGDIRGKSGMNCGESADGERGGNAEMPELIDGIIRCRKDKIRANVFNGLYAAAAEINPDLERVRGEVVGAGAFACVMTGSGNAFVGLFDDGADARKAAEILSKKGYEEIIVCRAADKGIAEF
ncbi:MAG: hypothetical protein LBP62_00905 [Clostridiales bacterium]|jgi:4-diphosphocytidyl-2C-methyl-D-erythritol kinase|nr:hypothetical protein [Clostridiales bacterium]